MADDYSNLIPRFSSPPSFAGWGGPVVGPVSQAPAPAPAAAPQVPLDQRTFNVGPLVLGAGAPRPQNSLLDTMMAAARGASAAPGAAPINLPPLTHDDLARYQGDGRIPLDAPPRQLPAGIPLDPSGMPRFSNAAFQPSNAQPAPGSGSGSAPTAIASPGAPIALDPSGAPRFSGAPPSLVPAIPQYRGPGDGSAQDPTANQAILPLGFMGTGRAAGAAIKNGIGSALDFITSPYNGDKPAAAAAAAAAPSSAAPAQTVPGVGGFVPGDLGKYTTLKTHAVPIAQGQPAQQAQAQPTQQQAQAQPTQPAKNRGYELTLYDLQHLAQSQALLNAHPRSNVDRLKGQYGDQLLDKINRSPDENTRKYWMGELKGFLNAPALGAGALWNPATAAQQQYDAQQLQSQLPRMDDYNQY